MYDGRGFICYWKKIFAEGRAEGRELGLEEGRAEGREEGRIDTILEMFESGYLPVEVALKETGLDSEAALQAYIKEENISN